METVLWNFASRQKNYHKIAELTDNKNAHFCRRSKATAPFSVYLTYAFPDKAVRYLKCIASAIFSISDRRWVAAVTISFLFSIITTFRTQTPFRPSRPPTINWNKKKNRFPLWLLHKYCYFDWHIETRVMLSSKIKVLLLYSTSILRSVRRDIQIHTHFSELYMIPRCCISNTFPCSTSNWYVEIRVKCYIIKFIWTC